MELKVHFDNENKFTDYTSQDLFQYADTDYVGKYAFQHLKYGIYVPAVTDSEEAGEGCLILTKEEIKALLEEYEEVVFLTKPVSENKEDAQSRFRICFAYSSRDVGVDYVERWLDLNVESEEWLKPYQELIKGSRFEDFGNDHAYWGDYQEFMEKGKKALTLQLPEKDPDRNYIVLLGKIGVMVEPGIYYFSMPGDKREGNMPHINYNTPFQEKVAGICQAEDFHPSMTGWLEYLAIGEENFARLKEIVKMSRGGFYHEFRQQNEDEETKALRQDELRRILNDVMMTEELTPGIVIEEDAEELVQGIGFRKIELYFSIPLVSKEKPRTYEAAYKLGDQLILIDPDGKREEIDMHLIDTLYVNEKKVLQCGVTYPVVHRVIDCKEEKLREILTEEAYRLYKGSGL